MRSPRENDPLHKTAVKSLHTYPLQKNCDKTGNYGRLIINNGMTLYCV